MKKIALILGLLMLAPGSLHARDESTKYGIISSGVIMVYFGSRLITRGSYSTFDKIFEVVGGTALIAAGLASIVLSGEITHKIENLYYK